MLETLEKMSGTRHVARATSKSYTENREALAMGKKADVSITVTKEKESVISYNDLMSLPMCNAVIFRAGQSPIWNRNQMSMPMSFALFPKDGRIPDPGGKPFQFKSVPSMSTAMEFDAGKNTPNFFTMFEKRLTQATKAATAMEIYKTAYGYSDFELSQLDRDVYSAEVMDIIDIMLSQEAVAADIEKEEADEMEADIPDVDIDDPSQLEAAMAAYGDDPSEGMVDDFANNGNYMSIEEQEAMFEAQAAESEGRSTRNVDLERKIEEKGAERAERSLGRYARGKIGRDMLVDGNGRAFGSGLDATLRSAVNNPTVLRALWSDDHFTVSGEDLLIAETGKLAIRKTDLQDVDKAREMAKDESLRVYDNNEEGDFTVLEYEVENAFKEWLASLDSWKGLGDGKFDAFMAREFETVTG